MFGGSMPNARPFAAVANEYIDSFPEDYEKSLEVAKEIFNSLSSKFKLEEITNGSNVMKLHVLNGAPADIQSKLLESNVKLNNPTTDFRGFYVKINPSILRVDKKKIIQYFDDSSA